MSSACTGLLPRDSKWICTLFPTAAERQPSKRGTRRYPGYTLSEENTAVRYVIPEDQTVTVTWKETAEAAVDNTLKKWRADIYKLDAEHADRNDQSSMPQLMAADGYEYKSAEDLGYPYGYTRGDATLEGAVYGVYLNGELVKTLHDR